MIFRISILIYSQKFFEKLMKTKILYLSSNSKLLRGFPVLTYSRTYFEKFMRTHTAIKSNLSDILKKL